MLLLDVKIRSISYLTIWSHQEIQLHIVFILSFINVKNILPIPSWYKTTSCLSYCFTDIEEVVKNVLKTGIHENSDTRAEYAIAVNVVPYYNRICSVWVYVASVTGK